MRTCVITGATSGIGLESAKYFLRAGDQVVVCGRDADKIATTVKELSNLGLGPGEVRSACFDVADQAAVERAIAEMGPIDVLIAAAGVCRQARLDEAHSDQVWNQLINVNLHGAYYCIKAAAPRMVDGGAMVAVSSGLGKNARPGYEAYCASKHGLQGLVKCVALELAPRRIRVNAVCPGWVDTPMSRADVAETARRRGVDVEEFRAQALAGLPLGRMVEPEDVANLMGWLCSSGASAITGQAYNISCGEYFN